MPTTRKGCRFYPYRSVRLKDPIFYKYKYTFGNTSKVLKLVQNGKLLKENFTVDEIDINEVYMLLRAAGIRYLSEVEHAYYEQSGQLSVFKYENPMLVNSILPEDIEEVEVKI